MGGEFYLDPDWTGKVTLPIKRVGDHWEFLYGGELPVAEGTLADLTLATRDITEKRFKERVTKAVTIKVLEEGASLLVALSDPACSGRMVDWPEPRPLDVPAGTSRFVRVTLGPVRIKPGEKPLDPSMQSGGLWITAKGVDRCELKASSVNLPAEVSSEPAQSLNHAVTLLSRFHETHRISNTGNAYTKVFYQDRDERWYPLNDLRRGVQAAAERALLQDTWASIEAKLGWRPSVKP